MESIDLSMAVGMVNIALLIKCHTFQALKNKKFKRNLVKKLTNEH